MKQPKLAKKAFLLSSERSKIGRLERVFSSIYVGKNFLVALYQFSVPLESGVSEAYFIHSSLIAMLHFMLHGFAECDWKPLEIKSNQLQHGAT
jgi:hypothetical protein